MLLAAADLLEASPSDVVLDTGDPGIVNEDSLAADGLQQILKKNLEAAAQEEKKRILASATQEIESQKQAAIADLRRTTADLSIGIAGKLLRQNLDDAKNRALVDSLIQEVSRKA